MATATATPQSPPAAESSPAAGFLRFLALPCCFVVYSRFAVMAGNSLPGLLDAVSFGMLFLLVTLVLGSVRWRWLRFLAMFLLTGFFILFYVGNAAYHRFFEDWVHYQILNEWRLGPSVAGGALRSLTWWDWSAGIAAPLVLTWFVARRPCRLRLRRALPLGVAVLIVAVGCHQALCARSFLPREHNAFMNFVGGWVQRHTMVYLNRDRLDRIRNRIWDYYPEPRDGYVLGTDPEYPLLKVPSGAPDPEPLLPIDPNHPPNIVLVLMESVRAAESGAYGAEPSFTPNLDRLAAEGLLVKNFYANGTQTVRGELALLCSYYPDFGGGPIYINWPKLRLESLPAILRHRGYRTLWISCFPSTYANKAGFLARHGIDEFHDGREHWDKMPTLGWGQTDEFVFQYAAGILDRQKGPFFAEIMTLSNHWDFQWDYPTNDRAPVVSSDAQYTGYTRGIYYTDYAVGRFLESVRDKPWFDNTIFVFTGDHGAAVFPSDGKLTSFQKTETYFRSPMILYAPKLISPQVCETVGSQVDFAPTMLHLLGIRARNSFVGRSLLAEDGDPSRRFALMIHIHRWNLRIGNRYLYDVDPEFFHADFPVPPPDYKPDPRDHHVLLVSKDDLLRITDPERIAYGAEEVRHRLRQWAEDLILMNTYLMEWDWVYDRP